MKPSATHVLRIGLAITFLWISVLIFQAPLVWAGLMQPWAARLLPAGSLTALMLATAGLDALIGLLLLINVLTWAAAALGALHLVTVLITTGITSITVRDIGLLFACAALAASVWPSSLHFGMKNPPRS
jgi:hypothetical protein